MRRTLEGRIVCSGIWALVIGATLAHGAAPSDPNERARLVGTPTALQVQPDNVTLNGSRSFQQVIVTGQYADKSVRDLTGVCEFSVQNPEFAVIGKDGFLEPRKDGTTVLVVKAGGQTAQVSVAVKGMEATPPVSFRHELIASLNVGGCNAGACHGTPSGKGGFKLSLRGYDPAADYLQLTRDVFGRRTGRIQPESSLILQKALGRIPHEGGQRFPYASVPAKTVQAWLAEGLQDDPTDLPALKQIQVLPGQRVLNEPARWQQLAVMAQFADGSRHDVTRFTVFTTSDDGVAGVNSSGLVEFRQGGEVAILCRYLDQLQAVRLTYLEPKEGFTWNNPPELNYVDKHIFAKLKMLNILPSDLCSDQEFIRRTYIDVCGILPTGDEVRNFMGSQEKDKRAKLIDALLERPDYADFWTLHWADVLRNNRKTIQVKGAHAFHEWIHDEVSNNQPFDQMVREILTANGSTFANPPANFYRIARDPQSLAETTAQLFFGVRMQCAKCHNHPFERWSQDDYYSLAAFFARVKQRKDSVEPGDPKTPGTGSEVIYSERSGEVEQPRTKKQMAPKIIGVAAPVIPPGKDRREVLAELVTSTANPFFARSMVNRIWYHLNGKGIVDPVDDFRDSNPSANDELLDALAKDFIDHKYDVKYIIKVITTSRTYQLSAQTNKFNKEDSKYFSHAVSQRLSAEVLLDAICSATEVPEKFPGMPAGTRAVQLPDGDPNNPFLKAFGQPARELACECERENDSTLSQALQLINGPTINGKIASPNNRVGKLLAKSMQDGDMLNELYLATLSRLPNEGETKSMLGYVAKATDKRKAWEDVHWALINCKEFLFRH
jgi:hypothetical protein